MVEHIYFYALLSFNKIRFLKHRRFTKLSSNSIFTRVSEYISLAKFYTLNISNHKNRTNNIKTHRTVHVICLILYLTSDQNYFNVYNISKNENTEFTLKLT